MFIKWSNVDVSYVLGLEEKKKSVVLEQAWTSIANMGPAAYMAPPTPSGSHAVGWTGPPQGLP